MEQDFSQLYFCGTPLSDSSLPAEKSLPLDSSLEMLFASGEYNNFSKPPELSELFPSVSSASLTSDMIYSTSCALPEKSEMLFDDNEDIGCFLDRVDSFQSVDKNDLLSSLEDYPLQTSVCEPITVSISAPQNDCLQHVCKMEDTSEPTLSELNAPISFDDIESIIYNDLHADVKPIPPVVTASLTTSVSHPHVSKPSPCLQQLLSGSVLVSDPTSHSASVTTPSALRLSPIQEQPLELPVKSTLHSPTAAAQLSPPAKRAKMAADQPATVTSRQRTVSGSSSSSESRQGQGHSDTTYFWQYNTQAKGPKGQRLCKGLAANDPHKIVSFEDPVFDPKLSQWNLRHTGKARRGDGNDIAPNSYRLYQIGKELEKLNTLLDGITPEELPVGEQPKAKRAKNKYASRACRLKRKAQHEANKLKLFGLEQEHGKSEFKVKVMVGEAGVKVKRGRSRLELMEVKVRTKRG